MRRVSGRWSVACGVSAALYSLCSHAADEAGPVNLEEVVVTAEKRAERAIDVPISISTVNTQDLATQDLVQIQDYYSRIPGLQYNGDTTYDLSIRGITTGNSTSPTLSILVDDVPFGASTVGGLGNSHFPDFDPSMLERVEVLRGPQGTLYGASSLGGSIKFVTRQPDLETFSGRVEAGFESTDGGDMGWSTRGSVNIPIVTDVVGLRVSAFKRDDPAWLDNVVSTTSPDANPGKNVNTADTRGGHAVLLIKPYDGLSVTFSALEQKRDAAFFSGIQVNENANGYPVYSEPQFGGITNLSLGPTADTGNQQLYSGRVEADLPAGMHLTSITAWQKSAGTNYQDVTTVFTFLPFVYGPGSTSIVDAAQTEKFSQELRLSGKIDNLDWRGGLFYTHEASSVNQTLDFTGTGTNSSTSAVPYAGLGPYTYKERAVFADFTYHFTSQFDVRAGVRWARNDQISGSSAVVDPAAVMFFGPSSTGTNLTSSDTSTTWELSPSYHFTQDLMGYVRVATGYRPGGPNAILPNVSPTYGPDKVTNYELGLKGITGNRTINYDVSLFDIEWKNIQLQDTDAANELTYTTNGSKARSRGLEAETTWKPIPSLTIGANATLLDAYLTGTIPPQTGVDTLIGNAGDRLPGSARFTSNLSIEQDFPIVGNMTGFVSGNWSYVGSRLSTFQLFVPGTDDVTNTTSPRFDLPGYSLVDFQTGAQWDGWRATLFLRNAFNKLGALDADNRNGTSVTYVDFLTPRTVGLTVSKDF